MKNCHEGQIPNSWTEADDWKSGQSSPRCYERRIARLTKANAELRETLTKIAGGSFKGASTLAINGDWHSMVDELQGIARAALANSSEGE